MLNAIGLLALALAVKLAIVAILFRRSRRLLRRKDAEITELSQRLVRQRQKSYDEKKELSAILAGMVEGVIVIGTNEHILYVSPNASTMFHMRSSELAGKPYWEVVPHQQINASIKEALAEQKAINKEITLIGPQDTFLSMQISPVTQEGRLTSVVAIFHDITELKKLLRLRSEFVANVSHELKTPLTSIKGYAETLAEAGEIPPNARHFLDIIHKQASRLELLVEDLLRLSTIESKDSKMDRTLQDLAPIVQSVLAMHKKTIEAAGHTATVDVPADLPKVCVDRHRLEQVFINLLDNAVKFTPTPGKITIRAKQEGPEVRVDVQDTGIGIGAEHLPRVFERFYRVDKARSSQPGSTGLGLAIVKHIVQAHQGRVEVQSTLGNGSTFSIFLPIK